MKQKRTIFLFLLLMLLGAVACNPTGAVEPSIEPTPEVDDGTADVSCPEAPEGAYRLSDRRHGICLHSPERYEVFAMNDGGFTLYAESLLNTEAPIASFSFEPLNGRTLEEIISQYLPGIDLDTARLQTVGLDGETGYILDNLPGQDTNRRVIAIRDGLVINIMVARIGEEYGAVGQEAETLFDTIVNSFRFIVVDPSAPLLANGEVIDPESPANDGGVEFIPTFEQNIAYVQDQTVFIQTPEGAPRAVQSCQPDVHCIIRYLKWSPNGQYLLYYFYDGETNHLQLTNTSGQIQTVTSESVFVMPGDWSPDGKAIVYLRPTKTYIEGDATTPPVHVHEVWTVTLDESGTLQEAELVGTTNRMPDGCGGGGRSASEVLYENEGGTSYGYLMGVLEWTASDILLYTSNCTNIGINRYDMANDTDLPEFEKPLRNLVMSADNRRWYAVTGHLFTNEEWIYQIATGTPEETAVTIIPTSNPVELVFVGGNSGKLYYTTRIFDDRTEIAELGAYFNYFSAGLWQINADGSGEMLLWESDDQAYANVTELPSGDILFVLVENDRALHEALLEGAATMEEMGQYAPQRHIVRKSTDGTPQILINSAGQPTLEP